MTSNASITLMHQIQHLIDASHHRFNLIDGPQHFAKGLSKIVADYEAAFTAEAGDRVKRAEDEAARVKVASEALLVQYLDRALSAEIQLRNLETLGKTAQRVAADQARGDR